MQEELNEGKDSLKEEATIIKNNHFCTRSTLGEERDKYINQTTTTKTKH